MQLSYFPRDAGDWVGKRQHTCCRTYAPHNSEEDASPYSRDIIVQLFLASPAPSGSEDAENAGVESAVC